MKDALGEKFGASIQAFSTFICGIVIGFSRGWKLTLVVIRLSPLVFAGVFIFARLSAYMASKELKAYARAGSITQEVFSSIRTVFAFNAARKEYKKYLEFFILKLYLTLKTI